MPDKSGPLLYFGRPIRARSRSGAQRPGLSFKTDLWSKNVKNWRNSVCIRYIIVDCGTAIVVFRSNS